MKNIKNVIFFGTHELAIPALETLVELELAPRLIITRPEIGLAPGPMLGEPPAPPPHLVKIWAEQHEIPLAVSRRVADEKLRERIAELAPDLLVVADYGRALPAEVAALAARGALQVHPSLLPKWRGEHSLRVAIGHGDRKIGVTTFLVDEEPWGGPILDKEEILLEGEETFGELIGGVGDVARRLLGEGIEKLDASKNPKTRKQNPKSASKAPRITSRHRRAPWQLEAKEVFNRWRAYCPPGLVTSVKFRTVEIIKGGLMPWIKAPFGETGTYLGMRTSRITVLCGRQSAFGIEEVRLEGQTECISATDAEQELGLQVGDQFV